MAIKGSLKEASLADVCQLLALGLKTGCLSITDRSRFGQIFFDRGRITFSRIVNRRDRLGDLLVKENVITQDQLNAAVAQQPLNSDKKLGEVLVDQGLITTADLTRFVLALHTAGPAGDVGGDAAGPERWLSGRSEAQMRRRPGPGLNSIVWLLWHMAGTEDVAVTVVVAGHPQVFDDT